MYNDCTDIKAFITRSRHGAGHTVADPQVSKEWVWMLCMMALFAFAAPRFHGRHLVCHVLACMCVCVCMCMSDR